LDKADDGGPRHESARGDRSGLYGRHHRAAGAGQGTRKRLGAHHGGLVREHRERVDHLGVIRRVRALRPI
jgi:hypothetical protein